MSICDELAVSPGNQALLEELAEIEGLTVEAMAESAVSDSVAPGICRKGCGYATGVEPDCVDGWCEECETGSVVSCLVLLGII